MPAKESHCCCSVGRMVSIFSRTSYLNSMPHLEVSGVAISSKPPNMGCKYGTLLKPPTGADQVLSF